VQYGRVVSGVSVNVRASVRTAAGWELFVEVPAGFSVPAADGLILLQPEAGSAADARWPLFGSAGDPFVGVKSEARVRVALRVAAANRSGVVVHGRAVPAVMTGLALGTARWLAQGRRAAGLDGAVVTSAVRPARARGVVPVGRMVRLDDGAALTVWELMPVGEYLRWRRGTFGCRDV
jgi:hypothetical protein